MKMKIDYEKARQLVEDKSNITKEEYNKRLWRLWEKLYKHDDRENREIKTKVNKRILELYKR